MLNEGRAVGPTQNSVVESDHAGDSSGLTEERYRCKASSSSAGITGNTLGQTSLAAFLGASGAQLGVFLTIGAFTGFWGGFGGRRSECSELRLQLRRLKEEEGWRQNLRDAVTSVACRQPARPGHNEAIAELRV
jgi:hypothetical protein